MLAKEFSILTPENCMKMTFTQPTNGRWDFADADALVSWAAHRGKQIRGHNLIWTGRNPQWLSELAPTLSPVELDRVMSTHIKTTAGHFAGQVYSWDVVNEACLDAPAPGSGSFFKPAAPWFPAVPDYVDVAFRAARAADPAALLFYNDFGAEQANTSKADTVYAMVKSMVARGGPIDGVGLQGHFSLRDPPSGARVAANIARLGALGLQVHVTEMDGP